jgi:hypothetical protein
MMIATHWSDSSGIANGRTWSPSGGIHDTTLNEVEKLFVDTSRRRMLFENLKKYLSFLSMTGWPCEVLLDGSFVLQHVPEPNDIDLILLLPENWDFDRRDFSAIEYNSVDRGHTKRVYKIEVYSVIAGTELYDDYIQLFSRIRAEWCDLLGIPRSARKGLLRILP